MTFEVPFPLLTRYVTQYSCGTGTYIYFMEDKAGWNLEVILGVTFCVLNLKMHLE